MPTIPEMIAEGLLHHQAHRLQFAEQWYLQVLNLDPQHARAWHLLGLLAHQSGRQSLAIERIERAIALSGDDPAFHNDLGIAYQANNALEAAEDSLRRALQLNPDYAEAYGNLGNVLKARGEIDNAVTCCQKAISLSPGIAALHFNLGVALAALGRIDDSISSYRRALDLNPNDTDVYCNLGNSYRDKGNLPEAISCFQRALELMPASPDLHNNLGNAYKDLGRSVDAVACFHRALQLRPDFDVAFNNLGSLHLDQSQTNEAIECFQQALQINPNLAEAHSNLGAAYRSRGQFLEALASCRKAVQLKPDHAEAQNNLGNILKDLGRVNDAVLCYQQAVRLKPGFAKAHSNLLFAKHYCIGVTQAELATAHAEFDQQHGVRPNPEKDPIDPNPNRPLRVGFVSPDFGHHPVGYFLIRCFENLDPKRIVTVCYSDRGTSDEMTSRFRAAATIWKNVHGISNAALTELIAADQIDILVDLAGHTSQNRLLVFVQKSAPLQVTWLGYEGTTGLGTMDYILADNFTIPPDFEEFYRERVIRFSQGYASYDAPTDAPDVDSLPALQNGHIRFACFNNLAKINPEVIRTWSRILKRTLTSVLVLKYAGLEIELVREPLIALFAENGIDSSRLEFQPFSSRSDYLTEFGNVDIALDPFPFGGGITTCDALWMGVPVITLPGETFASRHGLSHIVNSGLKGTIARNLDDYVNLAVSLANDWERLASLRNDLRPNMSKSSLCDGQRHAEDLMRIFCTIWKRRIGDPSG